MWAVGWAGTGDWGAVCGIMRKNRQKNAKIGTMHNFSKGVTPALLVYLEA